MHIAIRLRLGCYAINLDRKISCFYAKNRTGEILGAFNKEEYIFEAVTFCKKESYNFRGFTGLKMT